jgi:hypothetical protein
MSATALIRIKRTYRPVSGDLIGVRIQACVPNMNARKMKKSSKTASGFYASAEQVPAFTGRYLINESMDYASESDIKPADMERFEQSLRWKGFTEFKRIDLKDEPKVPAKISEYVAGIIAKIDAQDAPF